MWVCVQTVQMHAEPVSLKWPVTTVLQLSGLHIEQRRAEQQQKDWHDSLVATFHVESHIVLCLAASGAYAPPV